MSTIRLKNIKIYAFHGCMLEEGQIGSDYLVNISIKANLEKAAVTDNLKDTVVYVLLHKIVKEEMAIRSKLLEHVAQRIVDSVFAQIDLVDAIKVKVSKVNPPIGGDVEDVSVSISKKR